MSTNLTVYWFRGSSWTLRNFVKISSLVAFYFYLLSSSQDFFARKGRLWFHQTHSSNSNQSVISGSENPMLEQSHIKVSMPKETSNFFHWGRGWKFSITSIFVWSTSIPFDETLSPRIMSSLIIKWHFFPI